MRVESRNNGGIKVLPLFLGATLDSKFFKIYMPKSILKIQNFKP